MPTTIATTSESHAVGLTSQKLDETSNGILWTYNVDIDGIARFYRSQNQGATWTYVFSFSGLGGSSSALFIDEDDMLFFAFAAGGPLATTDGRIAGRIYLARYIPNGARTSYTLNIVLDMSGDPAAFGAERFDRPDVVAHKGADGGAIPRTAHVVFSGIGGGQAWTFYRRANYITSGAHYAVNASPDILGGPHSAAYFTNPIIDFRHDGRGKRRGGNSTPDLFVGWAARVTGPGQGVRFRKAVHSLAAGDDAWTWNAERAIDEARMLAPGDNASWMSCIFDGRDVRIVGHLRDIAGVFTVQIRRRDLADTTTTMEAQLDATVASNIASGTAAVDNLRNVWLFGKPQQEPSGAQRVQYWYYNAGWDIASDPGLFGPFTVETPVGSTYAVAARKHSGRRGGIDVVYNLDLTDLVAPHEVRHHRFTRPGMLESIS